MTRTVLAVVTAAAFALASAPGLAKEPVPKKVGDCVTTTLKTVGTRLEGIADSGSAVEYTDGLFQVSYDTVPGIVGSRAGDTVKLCLTEVPDECPPGDDRGKVYHAINLRTHKSWDASDSEHSCGGA